MSPTIGQIVIYRLNVNDAAQIRERPAHPHAIVRVGAGERYPMLVTRVIDTQTVNGMVFADGEDTFWVAGRQIGSRAGEWQFD